MIEKRLDPYAITREQKLSLPAIPKRQRKHPFQMNQKVQAEFAIGIKDCLSVACGLKTVTFLFEFGAQLAIIVDLPVISDD